MRVEQTGAPWFFIRKYWWDMLSPEEQALGKVDPHDVNCNGSTDLIRVFYPASLYKENYIDCHNIRHFEFCETRQKLVVKKLRTPEDEIRKRIRKAALEFDFDEVQKLKQKLNDLTTTISKESP
jgi:hypothetical protein